jgi:hypothetical protein
MSERSRSGSNLVAVSLNPLDYGFISALRKPALFPSLLIAFIPGAQSLWSKVERVAEGFMDTAQDICPGHEHLHKN